jgi:tryptophan 2,3-dioxygenase
VSSQHHPGAPPLRAATADERALRAVANDGVPTVAFDSRTPYDVYVGASVLHDLQHPLTAHPQEMAFLVSSQAMELYFGLLAYEWRVAQTELRGGRTADATRSLRRSVHHLRALNGIWDSLAWLTPMEFNSFRDELGLASGFQSAMYRHVEFLLGNKSETLIRPHHGDPAVYEGLTAALAEPSLYDDVLALLARRGHAVPAAVLERDPAAEYLPSPEVEAVWVSVYREGLPDGELFRLAETLTDIAEEFTVWRHKHLMSVRRSMGAKAGSGGSAGLRWLEKSLAREVFPELWSARTQI